MKGRRTQSDDKHHENNAIRNQRFHGVTFSLLSFPFNFAHPTSTNIEGIFYHSLPSSSRTMNSLRLLSARSIKSSTSLLRRSNPVLGTALQSTKSFSTSPEVKVTITRQSNEYSDRLNETLTTESGRSMGGHESSVRSNWTKPEIAEIFNLPFHELMYRAGTVHR